MGKGGGNTNCRAQASMDAGAAAASTAASDQSSGAELQQQFASAWGDLRERLDRGFDQLTQEVKAADPGSAQYERLMWKRIGVEDAILMYEKLHDELRGGRLQGDHAGTWRSFTDAVEAAKQTSVTTIGRNQGHRQGLDLALHYQRGYADFIDAPHTASSDA